MQKGNGKSCSRVPIRLINGACATAVALSPTVSVVAFALFVIVKFNRGGQAEGAGMTHTCCFACVFVISVLLFYSLIYPHRRPYASIFSLLFVLFRPRDSHLFLFSTYAALLAAFLVILAPLPSEPPSFFFLPTYFYGLACFVVFSYPVRKLFAGFTSNNIAVVLFTLSRSPSLHLSKTNNGRRYWVY